MTFDERLAERVRKALKRRRGVSEKKMFGGLSFLINGNMAVGIVGKKLVVRVGAEAHPKALTRKNVTPMTFTGKPMKGLVYVEPNGTRSTLTLHSWVAAGANYAASLPKK